MKPLIIFFMAIAAINGFFLGDQAKQDFYQEMERIFSSPHKYIMHGDMRIPLEPIKMSELMSAVEKFHALSQEERNSMINYLFGVRFPRPVPAGHVENVHPFDDEKLKEIHEKWNSMTPEEREEVRNNKRKDFEHTKPDYVHRFRRDTPEHNSFPRPVPAGHVENVHTFDDEKLKEIHDKWNSMTPEEREEVRNNKRKDFEHTKPDYVHRFPREMPEHQHMKHHFDEQKMKELHEKIESMTPEEREEFRRSFRKDHGETRHHSGRSFQAIRPLPEFINLNDIPNTRPINMPFPRPGDPSAPRDNIGSIHNNWNSRPFPKPEKPRMTRPIEWVAQPAPLPEVDRILYPIDGSFQPIKPLRELESAVPQQAPLPEVDRILYPIDGNFQPIKPLKELENAMIQPSSDNGRTRPVDPVARDRMPQPIKPLPIRKSSTDYSTLFDDMTDEERLQVIRELFPEGLPIRPIGPIPIIPAEKDSAFTFEHVDDDDDDDEETKTRNIEDYPHRSRRPRNFQPILPLQRQPIMPIKSQPILPHQSQPILPINSQPILPFKSQPILPQQFQPIMPLQRQPILPIKSQPILPRDFQPIMPF